MKVDSEERDILFDASISDLLTEKGYGSHVRPPGFGITVEEYAGLHNIHLDAARKLLNRAVVDGVLQKTQLTTGPKTRPCVYHRPGDWPPK